MTSELRPSRPTQGRSKAEALFTGIELLVHCTGKVDPSVDTVILAKLCFVLVELGNPLGMK